MSQIAVPTSPENRPAPRPRDFGHAALRWLIAILCLIGWYVSGDLFTISLGNAPSKTLTGAICASNPAPGGADCSSVLNSTYGRFGFAGVTPEVPIAMFGAVYFIIFGAWVALVGLPRRRRWLWHLPAIALAICGAAVSAMLMKIMATDLHAWCIGCVVVHIANLLAIVMALGGTIANLVRRTDLRLVTPTSTALAALAASFGLGAAQLFYGLAAYGVATTGGLSKAYMDIVSDPEYAKWRFDREPLLAIPEESNRPVLGAPDAPNTVVIFSDFQCPACKQAHDVLNQIMIKHPGALRVLYRHYPLNTACNPKHGFVEHPAACRAAAAAEAAYAVGGTPAFVGMKEVMYGHQTELSLAKYTEWAAQLGLDRDRFISAMESAETKSRIATDVELGQKLNLPGVPVLYLNGRKIERPRTVDSWNAILGFPTTSSAPASGPAR